MDAGAPIAWTDAPTGRYQVLSQSSDHSGYTTRKMDGEHGIREDPSASQFAELGSKPDAWGRGEVQVGSWEHSLVECVMNIMQNAREVCQMLPPCAVQYAALVLLCRRIFQVHHTVAGGGPSVCTQGKKSGRVYDCRQDSKCTEQAKCEGAGLEHCACEVWSE